MKKIQIISLERNAKNKNFWVQGCYDWSGTNNICFGQKQIEIILQLQIMKSWALLLFFSLSISCPLICICTGKHHHYMIQDNPCWCPVWAWWANETDNQRNADCTNNIQLHTPVCPPASSSLIWYIQCSPALIIISWRHTAFTRLITIQSCWSLNHWRSSCFRSMWWSIAHQHYYAIHHSLSCCSHNISQCSMCSSCLRCLILWWNLVVSECGWWLSDTRTGLVLILHNTDSGSASAADLRD